jgi:hypothetical protein
MTIEENLIVWSKRGLAMSDAYRLAQDAMAKLRVAIHIVLEESSGGLSNAEIGRSLGIYSGHVGHEGHISRTLLALMEAEGVAEQDKGTKLWMLRKDEAIMSDDK